MSSSIQEALDHLGRREPLSKELAQRVFGALMGGGVAEASVRALLLGLRDKGETVDELVGAALALREVAMPFPVPPADLARAVDVCGTGGDGQGTINVSTIASFIIAAAGVPVLKHGNRAASSACGSADLLEALGIDVATTPDRMLDCFKRTNFAFLFAPSYHPAMKHVAPVRKALGVRTIFNLIGPLANPAGVKRQLVGVAAAPLVPLMAGALQALGVERAAVVHGADGGDEVSVTGLTTVAEVRRGAPMTTTTFDVEQALGIRRVRPETLRGGDAAANARLARQLLASGADEQLAPMQAAVLVNAAWGIAVSGQYPDSVAQCMDVARLALTSGAALRTLQDVQKCLPRV